MTVYVVLICCIWLLMLRNAGQIRTVMANCGRRSMMIFLMLFIPCLQQLKNVFLPRRRVRKTMFEVGRDGIAEVVVGVRIVRWAQ
jgi:hypothetical protein